MVRVYYVHWNGAELEERAAALERAGFAVLGHSEAGDRPRLPQPPPDAVVISLDRLPSHGRAVAEWIWEAKSRQQIPILFVGGKPDKVATTREKLPNATYCESSELLTTLRELVNP